MKNEDIKDLFILGTSHDILSCYDIDWHWSFWLTDWFLDAVSQLRLNPITRYWFAYQLCEAEMWEVSTFYLHGYSIVSSHCFMAAGDGGLIRRHWRFSEG